MKKIISFVLCLTLLFTVPFVSISAEKNVSAESGGDYTLSIDKETCVVSVTNTKTGEVFSTNPANASEDEYTKSSVTNDINSQLIVSYYDEYNKEATIGSYVASVKRDTAKITEKENCIRVDYDFSRKNEQFTIPVEYTLSGNELKVRIIVDEIEERGNVQICEISLLPYFLSGKYTDSGYVLIPDGSGAVIDFSDVNTSAQSYRQQIYGRNPGTPYYYDEGNTQSAILPVFGMGRGESAVLAVVDGDEASGYIRADCAGISSSYARAYTSFVYHAFETVMIAGQDWRYKEYTAGAEVRENEDFSVTYYFLENSDYTALAEQYRAVADKENGLEKLTDENMLTGAVKAYGLTTEKTAFLGIPYTKTVAATTLDDVEKILGDVTQSGGKTAVFLEDFGESASNLERFSKLKISSDVGGKKQLNSLSEKYSDNAAFYQIGNSFYESTCKLWLLQSRYARAVSKDYLSRRSYSLVTSEAQEQNLYALKASLLKKRTDKLIKNFSKQDNAGIAFDYLGSELYADYNVKNFTSRQDMKKAYQDILKKAEEKEVNVAVSGGNAYTAGLTDTAYNYPISSSGFTLQSRQIPFAQMVFHGYMNMVSYPINLLDEPDEAFLLCIESGTVPCFAVTGLSNTTLRRTSYKDLFGTCYADFGEEFCRRLAASAELFEKIYDSAITSYSSENGVSQIIYENGIKVIVNYNDTAVSVGGNTVEAKNYVILG